MAQNLDTPGGWPDENVEGLSLKVTNHSLPSRAGGSDAVAAGEGRGIGILPVNASGRHVENLKPDSS